MTEPRQRRLAGEATSDAGTDSMLVAWYITQYTKDGWQVISQSERSVQFTKPKPWNAAVVVPVVIVPLLLGCLWHWVWGIALLGLLACIADYLLKKDARDDLTVDDVLSRATEAWQKQQP